MVTVTGTTLFVVVPFPSWPTLLDPQHFAVPPANNAHECILPAEIATAFVPADHPVTATGVVEHGDG